MPIAIREAKPDDAGPIMQIAAESPMAPQWSAEQYAEMFGQERSRARILLVAESLLHDERQVLGFLVASNVGDEWELENIVVGPSAKRQGLGTKLMQELIKRAEIAGGHTVHLEVRASNSSARGLYEKCGFGFASHRKAYYAHPQEDAILYRLSL